MQTENVSLSWIILIFFCNIDAPGVQCSMSAILWAHACFTPKCLTFCTKRRVKSDSLIHLKLKWLSPALYMHNWQALCALLFIPPECHEKFMWFDFSAMYGGAVMSRPVWQVNTGSDTHALHAPEREPWNPITPGNNFHVCKHWSTVQV